MFEEPLANTSSDLPERNSQDCAFARAKVRHELEASRKGLDHEEQLVQQAGRA